MERRINDIILKIDNKISNIDLSLEYKQIERKILEEILVTSHSFSINSSQIVSVSNVVLSAIILNEKYDDINEVLTLFNKHKEKIDNLSSTLLEDYCCAVEKMMDETDDIKELVSYLDGDIEKLISGISSKITFGKSNKKINLEAVEMFKLFALADLNLLFITSIIQDLNEKKIELQDYLDSIEEENIDKKKIFKNIINNYINEIYKKNTIDGQLSRIGKYFQQLNKDNKKFIKDKKIKLGNLNELKKFLSNLLEKEEVTNIEKICNIIPIGLKSEVLRLIDEINQKYYSKLEEEYIDTKENSLANYIDLFNKINIDFTNIPINLQEQILKIKVEKLKHIIKFLEDINVVIDTNIIDTIINTNTEYINNLNKYIEKGMLTKKFIKDNINIICDEEMYNKLVSNINILLQNDINIIGIDQDSIDIFLKDSLLISSNIELCDKLQINIRTRHLKNYMFLSDELLEEKISGLKEINIDINNNLEVLNSDINIIKRIKICTILGINIYENDKIRLDILNKEEFFIPNSKLDDYLPEESKQKTL